jgi:predicted glycoside hydrolase/deacetylase ChbG (UPF0249 family)
MTGPRLIVNADDFGRSRGINAGTIKSHRHGIVTSASMMVRWPAAEEAAAYAREHPGLSTGLHVDLGEWAYAEGDWHEVYGIPEDLERAVTDQLSRFRELVGRAPTHLDSHQHAHRKEPATSILLGVAEELGVPLRSFSPRVTYIGAFYGQTSTGDPVPDAITVEGLIAIISGLGGGFTELSCHPGDGSDLDSSYCAERAVEVATLCDPRVRAALAARNVHLASFSDL